MKRKLVNLDSVTELRAESNKLSFSVHSKCIIYHVVDTLEVYNLKSDGIGIGLIKTKLQQ